MPDIYLVLEGRQEGPYSPVQIRQLLAEGQVTAETPAWYQGLPDWSTLGQIMAAFPAEGGPPAFFPPALTSAKKQMSGCVLAAIIVGVAGFLGIFILSCLAGIALGPITNGIKKAKESASMQQARAISLAMFQYANDHNGAYPDGNTSTEVFQKLLDGKYISYPGIFYVSMPGKIKATSNTLTAENVCYDVTSSVTTNSPDDLPLVFSTGYAVTYYPGTAATLAPGAASAFPGMIVAYKNNAVRFLNASPAGTVAGVVPGTFIPGTKIYVQLKP